MNGANPDQSNDDKRLAKEYIHTANLFNKESHWYTVSHRGVVDIEKGTSYFINKDTLLKYNEKKQGILRNRAKSRNFEEPKWKRY